MRVKIQFFHLQLKPATPFSFPSKDFREQSRVSTWFGLNLDAAVTCRDQNVIYTPSREILSQRDCRKPRPGFGSSENLDRETGELHCYVHYIRELSLWLQGYAGADTTRSSSSWMEPHVNGWCTKEGKHYRSLVNIKKLATTASRNFTDCDWQPSKVYISEFLSNRLSKSNADSPNNAVVYAHYRWHSCDSDIVSD